VGDLELELIWLFAIRAFVLFVVWQTIWLGAAFRHEMRRGGWSPTRIRLVTVGMWAFVVLEVAGFVGFSPMLYAATMAVFLAAFLGSNRIIAAIVSRTNPRILLVREVHRIYSELDSIEGPEDRARFDDALAALDRWVAPDTFEFIQLARSRVLSWFDGGPRAADRETRWSKRMTEVVALLTPPWRPDRLSRIADVVRRVLLAHANWLALGSAGILGASVFFGRSPILVVPFILLGWLATSTTPSTIWIALVGSATGLAISTVYVVMVDVGGNVLPPWIATVAGIEVVVLLAAWMMARSTAAASARVGLRLLTPPGAEASPVRQPVTDHDDRGPSAS
jgi:hypothetical protein